MITWFISCNHNNSNNAKTTVSVTPNHQKNRHHSSYRFSLPQWSLKQVLYHTTQPAERNPASQGYYQVLGIHGTAQSQNYPILALSLRLLPGLHLRSLYFRTLLPHPQTLRGWGRGSPPPVDKENKSRYTGPLQIGDATAEGLLRFNAYNRGDPVRSVRGGSLWFLIYLILYNTWRTLEEYKISAKQQSFSLLGPWVESWVVTCITIIHASNKISIDWLSTRLHFFWDGLFQTGISSHYHLFLVLSDFSQIQTLPKGYFMGHQFPLPLIE